MTLSRPPTEQADLVYLLENLRQILVVGRPRRQPTLLLGSKVLPQRPGVLTARVERQLAPISMSPLLDHTVFDEAANRKLRRAQLYVSQLSQPAQMNRTVAVAQRAQQPVLAGGREKKA